MLMNQTKCAVLAAAVKVADTFWQRLKGLLGTTGLPEGEGLLITPCNSVHTFGMKYPIDVLFVDRANRVLKTAESLHPGKLAVCPGSCYVVELPAGTLTKTGTKTGDILELYH